MNEAMRCDRISLMHAGVVLACDTPKALMAARGTDVLEEAFIGYIADASSEPSKGDQKAAEPVQTETLAPSTSRVGTRGAGLLKTAGSWPTAGARRSRSCATRCGSHSRSSARWY